MTILLERSGILLEHLQRWPGAIGQTDWAIVAVGCDRAGFNQGSPVGDLGIGCSDGGSEAVYNRHCGSMPTENLPETDQALIKKAPTFLGKFSGRRIIALLKVEQSNFLIGNNHTHGTPQT